MDKWRIDDLGYFPFAGGFRITGGSNSAAKRVSGCSGKLVLSQSQMDFALCAGWDSS
jgi:hypothetical protein